MSEAAEASTEAEVVTETLAAEAAAEAPATEVVPEAATEAPDPPPSLWDQNLNALPTELRSATSLQNVSSFEDLVTQFDNSQKLIGKKGIILPDTEDPADVQRYRTELGIPEEASGYDLSSFTPPEDIPWSDDLQNAMVAHMHESGMTNEQVMGQLSKFSEFQKLEYEGSMDILRQHHDQSVEALKKEWGGKYDAMTDLSGRAIRKGEEMAGLPASAIFDLTLADGTKLGNSPAVNKFFAAMGEAMSEHTFVGGEKLTAPAGNTPNQASDEISRLRMDEGFMAAYTSRDHPEHESAIRRMGALYTEVHGDEVAPDAPVLG